MHIVDTEQLSSIDNECSNLIKRRSKSFDKSFLLFSVLAHCFVALVIINEFTFSELDEQVPIDIEKPSIKSYLYIPLPKVSQSEKVAEKIPQITTEKSNEKKADTSNLTEKPVNDTPEELAQKVNEVPTESNLNQAILSATNQATKEEQQQNISPQQKKFLNYSSRDNIQRQLQAIEAKKLNELAQSASREFESNINSPAINAPVFSDEYLYSKQPGVHLITCDGSVKSKLKLMMGLMGGKIKCRDVNFQKHIDKYLKKEPEKEQN